MFKLIDLHCAEILDISVEEYINKIELQKLILHQIKIIDINRFKKTLRLAFLRCFIIS